MAKKAKKGKKASKAKSKKKGRASKKKAKKKRKAKPKRKAVGSGKKKAAKGRARQPVGPKEARSKPVSASAGTAESALERRAERKAEPAVEPKDRVGAAMVVGGGVGGIQAALDLAESGIKVYLVDRGPAIGGAMSQLDKTFPTCDCSLCILSPKMVEAGRHRNIELLTCSELKDLDGAPGRFRAKVLRRARSVDMEKCTGCGICTKECLVHNRITVRERVDAGLGLSPEDVAYLEKTIAKHRERAGALVQALQDIQRDLKYLPESHLRYVAAALGVPDSQAYGVATFYTAFSLKPKGEHLVQVCTGTACHVRGSGLILDRLQRELEIGPGETTTDGAFTLETVRCLGCCGLAPAVVIDEKTYGRVTPDGVPRLVDQYRGVAV